MGIVYKVYHPALQQYFALKCLLLRESDKEKIIKRFHREIQILAKLQHPAIIQIRDSGEDSSGKPYYVMEYIEGESLEELLKKEELPLRTALSLMQQILEGLDYLHQQGMIHRDLKLANLLVSLEGVPKIVDFGLAKAQDDLASPASQKLTQTGALLGTVHYMSPEQIQGDAKKITSASDIYSMGICLYRLLTQAWPYPFHPEETLPEVFQWILDTPPKPPSHHNSKLHQDLDTLLLKALEKTPERRYPSALHFAQDLDRFLKGYPLWAKPLSYREHFFKWRQRNSQSFTLILVSIFLIFLLFSSLFFWEWYRQSQALKRKYQQVLEFQKQAQSASGEGFLERRQEFYFLLQAFNQLNEILKISPQTRTLEQMKWDLGTQLIRFTCQQKEYSFAQQMVQELQQLAFFSDTHKQNLIQEVDRHRNAQKEKHLKRFHFWMERLQKEALSPQIRQDAIFEMAQMNEIEIHDLLLGFLEQSLVYFFESPHRTPLQDEFYHTIALILGRQKNPKTAPIFMSALQKIYHHLLEREGFGVMIDHTRFMVTLAEALGNLGLKGYSEIFHTLRVQFFKSNFFWSQTRRVATKLALYDALDQKEPQDAMGYRLRGDLHFEQKRYQKALLDYEEALKREPDYFYNYINRGYTRQKMKDFKGALADYEKIIAQHPERSSGYNYRALIWKEYRHYDKALEDCNKAIELDPQSATLYLNRGITQVRLKRYENALADYNYALGIDPQDEKAYLYRGLCYYRWNRFNEALQDFNKVIFLNPRNADAYENIGNVFLSQRKFEQAIRSYDQALWRNPQQPLSYSNRGYAKAALKDINGALQDYNTALERDPAASEFPEIYQNRGYIKMRMNDLLGATEDYTMAIELNPNDPKAYFDRGAILHARQLLEAAKKDFIIVLQKTKDSKEPEFLQYRHGILSLFPELSSYLK
jgi:serine/threonine protein kinase/Tfp pilus assembly protein PilF